MAVGWDLAWVVVRPTQYSSPIEPPLPEPENKSEEYVELVTKLKMNKLRPLNE